MTLKRLYIASLLAASAASSVLGQATFPPAASTGGGGSAGVSTFNYRSGAVTPAAGDYTASQVGAAPALSTQNSPRSAPLTDLYSGALANLTRIGMVTGVGDSYMAGQGADNDYSLTFMGLLQGDVPAAVYNYAISGTNADNYALQMLNNWNPDPGFTNIGIVSGDENDGNCSGPTAACGKRFILSNQFTYAWATIPFANKVMASNAACVQTSGTWTAYTSTAIPAAVGTGTGNLSLPVMTHEVQPGTALTTTGTAVLTCTIPTSTSTREIGINYGIANGSTSTFTVTVDGTAETDLGSGTATFGTAPLQGTLAGTQTVGVYRQEYPVSSATTHTVVITATASSSYPLSFIAADAAVPNSSSNNVVLQLGTNANWNNYAGWNGIDQTLASNFQADGLAVTYGDIVNGVTVNGTTYAVNATTDLSTSGSATYAASTLASHPSATGHSHYEQVILAMQPTLINPTGGTGFYFGSAEQVKNTSLSNAPIFSGPGVFSLAGVTAASTITLTKWYTSVSGTTPINAIIPPHECYTARSTCEVNLYMQSGGSSIPGVGLGGFYGLQTCPIYIGKPQVVTLDFVNGYWYQKGAICQNATSTTVLSGTSPHLYASNPVNVLSLQGNTTFTSSGTSGAAQTLQLRICQQATVYTVAFDSTFNIAPGVVAAINSLPASACAYLGFANNNGTQLDNTSATFSGGNGSFQTLDQVSGVAIASASTIAPVAGLFHVTGTTAIATITPPTGMSASVGGCLTMIADGAWTWTTAGNIYAAGSAAVGTPYQACYDGAKWYIK